MALGGVEIGRHIAADAAMAMPTMIVDEPPIIFSLSPIPAHTTVRIGIIRAAVAVLLIKLDKKNVTRPAMISMTIGFHSPKGMALMEVFAKPVPSRQDSALCLFL